MGQVKDEQAKEWDTSLLVERGLVVQVLILATVHGRIRSRSIEI